MEERKEEDEDYPSSNSSSSSNSNSKSKSKSNRSSSKSQYYSQPLPAASSLKQSAVRKNSLDDAAAVISDDSSAGGPNSGRSLSYPHYAFNSSPPPSYHHHHQHQYSSSSEDIRHPNSHLPPPFPPNQSANVVSAGPPFMSRKPTSSSFSSSDGVLTLERAMSEFGGAPGTLPEFVGAGGGTGIFRIPVRAAMHPGRPPALELRPHPLRETQYGSFLRTMASTDTQLWAGQESGLRFWNFTDVFDGYNSGSGVKKGDEECAPFYESNRGRTSPVLCMVVDEAMGFIWTGHKDGKIRSWRIIKGDGKVDDDLGFGEVDGDGHSEDRGVHFRERLSWQAHRHPVLSMIISSYGNDSIQFIYRIVR